MKLAVNCPVTIGRRKSSESETKTFVIVKPVSAKPIRPLRKATTTGAAVAVGVMPTKNAAFASEGFCGNRSFNAK